MLSFFKDFNLALAVRRVVWTGVYIAMFSLIVMMSRSLAADQPVLFTIIILSAFVGSIGLVYARQSFQSGAWLTGFAALTLGIGGILVHTILETSYWSSTIEQINADFQQESDVREARTVVSDKRKERYESLAGVRTAGQLEALIKREKLNPLWGRTASCTDVTQPDSRAFCDSFFAMEAEYHAATEAGNLEGVVWGAATNIETKVNRNIASAAILASKIFGGTVYDWIGIIVAMIVAFTQMLLALSLYVGYEREKRRAPVTAQKPQEAAPAVVTQPALQDDVVVQTAPQPPVTPPNDPRPTRSHPESLTTDDSAPDDTVQPENNVVTLYDPPVNKRDEKRRKKEIIDRQNRALVSAYVDERLDTAVPSAEINLTSKGGWKAGGTPGDVIYTDFRRWCRDSNHHAVGRSHFGRFIGEFVDRARNSKGVVYGAVIAQPIAKRKAA
jgi:hypothetical protein